MSSPPARVYVVDDEPDVGNGIAQSLADVGYETRVFTSGQSLLEAYPQLLPGCIIADMVMRKMSGMGELRKLFEP